MLPAGCARHFELTTQHVYQSMSPDTAWIEMFFLREEMKKNFESFFL